MSASLAPAPLLKIEDLHVKFPVHHENDMPWTKTRYLHAVNGISFDLMAGETLGVVGESGCGKSTLARAIIQMVPATGKAIWQKKSDLISLSKREMLKIRADIQMVFQDPLASLNPRMTVGEIIAEPIRLHSPHLSKNDVKMKVKAMMDKVGLLSNQINRYPHEFSGGQCQRIGIARALIVEPKLIICDEPVSALDVSIQAQVINLLGDLKNELGLSLIFIAHDLSVVKHISDRVMVLYLGKTMELAKCADLYQNPKHPYTKALLSAVPIPDPVAERAKKVIELDGDLPSPLNPPSGCVFQTRCAHAKAICRQDVPLLKGPPHSVACHFQD